MQVNQPWIKYFDLNKERDKYGYMQLKDNTPEDIKKAYKERIRIETTTGIKM